MGMERRSGVHLLGVDDAATVRPECKISENEAEAVECWRGVAEALARPALLRIGRSQVHALTNVETVVEHVGVSERDADMQSGGQHPRAEGGLMAATQRTLLVGR